MTDKTTKRALFSSVVALVLCFAMLLGTTYAWFTDSVASGSNVITAGNLDIKVEYNLTGKDTDWKALDGANDLFQMSQWEPGHTEVVALRVTNDGSLNLKYAIHMNIINEVVGTNKADEPIVLSDILAVSTLRGTDASIVTKAFADENGVVYDQTATFKAANVLGAEKAMAPAAVEYLVIKVDMAETVGNEANAKDKESLPSIEFGINVMATQLAYENDSFGNDYDADAIHTDFIVTSEAELVSALAEAKNGAVIGIKGNVTWTTGASIGSTPFVAADADVAYITLLGLDDDSTFTALGSGIGSIGIDNGTVVFKNLKIVDKSVSYAENSWECGYLEFRGNTVFENCEFVNAIMMKGQSAKFTNCSFNSNDDNQYAVWVSDGNASFENCYFTGARGLKMHEAYGSEVDTVVVNNSTFANLTKKPGIAIGTVNAATTIKITNNVFAATQPGDQNNYKYETDTNVTTFNFVDENNTANGALITTADQLAAVLASTGKNIAAVLAADIDLPISSLGQITAGSGEYKLGGEETETIVIDLNGHKLNITTTYWSNLGAKNPNATFIIKNGTMTSSQPTGTWNSYDLTFSNCNYVFENVVFDKAVALSNAGKSVTMTNVTINETHDYYALWIQAEGQNVTIDGLTVNSDNGRGIKIDEQYVDAPAKVTLNVSNAKFNTAKKAAILVKSAAGADIVLDNVDITNCTTDNTNHVWVDADADAYANLVTVTGGNVIVES